MLKYKYLVLRSSLQDKKTWAKEKERERKLALSIELEDHQENINNKIEYQ